MDFHPLQKAIIVSGFSETERVKQALNLGVRAYVKNPFLLDRAVSRPPHELILGTEIPQF